MDYGTDTPAVIAVLDNFKDENINNKDNDRDLSISTFEEAFGLISHDA